MWPATEPLHAGAYRLKIINISCAEVRLFQDRLARPECLIGYPWYGWGFL